MNDLESDNGNHNYWPGVADLFLSLFIIAVAMLVVIFAVLLPINSVGFDPGLVHAIGTDSKHLREPMNKLRAALGLAEIPITTPALSLMKAHSETNDRGVLEISKLQNANSALRVQLEAVEQTGDYPAQISSLAQQNGLLRAERDHLIEKLAAEKGTDTEQLKLIARQRDEYLRQLHDKPPIIQISEQKEEYRFESGSALMGEAFARGLMDNEFQTLANEILERSRGDGVKIDTLEVIGHTDGSPVATQGNFDSQLPMLLAGDVSNFSNLVPGSNNDLGLLRALAVKQKWSEFVEKNENREILEKIDVRCYSAGQTIPPKEVLNPQVNDFIEANSGARRIEMRLTRLKE